MADYGLDDLFHDNTGKNKGRNFGIVSDEGGARGASAGQACSRAPEGGAYLPMGMLDDDDSPDSTMMPVLIEELRRIHCHDVANDAPPVDANSKLPQLWRAIRGRGALQPPPRSGGAAALAANAQPPPFA